MSSQTTDDVGQLVLALTSMGVSADDAERIDRLRLFEELKSAAAAAQLIEGAAFDVSQRAGQAVAGEPVSRQGRGVAAQVALSMRVSPWQGQRWLGWAKILTTELPATFAELQAGRTTERRALLVARETAVLSREDRAAVDRELAPRLEGWGDHRVEREARAASYRLDPAGAVERAANAAADRRVTLRPAPDVMCRLTALLPVEHGVAAYAALCRHADAVVGTVPGPGGRPCTRGQVMADTLLGPVGVPAAVLPAGTARRLALSTRSVRWLRHGVTRRGRLVVLESRRREFSEGQRLQLRLRDQFCRTPYCGAPIRHARPIERGGPTAISNGAGLCEACNYAKQAVGWSAISTDSDDEYTVATPTGHQYRSRPPDPPGVTARARRPGPPPPGQDSSVEACLRTILAA